MKAYKVNSVQFFLSISWWFDALWISEKIVRESAFEKNKKKPWLSAIINRPLNNWAQNWNSLAFRSLGCCKVKTKAHLPWKKYSAHFFETSWPWYRQASDCCWRNISARDSSTETRNTPWWQDDGHLAFGRATSGFTLPSHHRDFWSVGNFCFSQIRKSKNHFHFGFHQHWYCFPQFRYTWIALSSLNF